MLRLPSSVITVEPAITLWLGPALATGAKLAVSELTPHADSAPEATRAAIAAFFILTFILYLGPTAQALHDRIQATPV
jgi:hypothetical protein